MGGDLLRRKALIRSLLFACISMAVDAGEISRNDGPLAASVPVPRSRTEATAPDYIEPVQPHAGPKLTSFPLPMTPPVENEIRKLSTAGGKKWIAGCLQRAVPYRSVIQENLRESAMPEEFFYLPVIESTYITTAVSKSGAAGLWQFMQNSISPFGIRVNEWVDERYDFWKSTEASLQKLRENYRAFGDWHLALAAYNCGLGRMTKIVRDSGVRDYWILLQKGLLPPETARYVPKFIAVVLMATNSATYGIDITWETPTEWERVPVDRAVDLSLLSEETGLPLEVLKKGNPELRYSVTPPEGSSYRLKVPNGYAEAVRKVVSDPKKKLLNFYIHLVQSGDTLSELSRHFGVSVSMIMRYNPGIRPERLLVGQKVLVPSLVKTGPLVREIDVDELKRYTDIYAVAAGDTLWSISRRYATTPEKLAAANGMSVNGSIRAGMTLNVPVKETDD